MRTNLEIVNPLEIADWDKMMLLCTNYSFFHSMAWINVLKISYQYTPYFFVEYKNKKMSAMIPFMEVKSILTGRKGVSLPFSDYCETYLSNEENKKNAINRIIEFAYENNWKYIEMRGENDIFRENDNIKYYYGHKMELENNEEKLFKSLRGSTKRNIKKAKKYGIYIEKSDTIKSLKEFYRLHCLTRKHHGLPPQPFLFFRNLYEHVIQKNNGHIFIGIKKGKIIASNICVHFGNKAMYKYGATDRKYQQFRASNLLMWEIIKYYSKNGFKTLDFGKTEPENIGLLQFKNGWGNSQYKIPYYRYDIKKRCLIKMNGGINKAIRETFKHTPIPVLRVIGRVLYRHVG